MDNAAIHKTPEVKFWVAERGYQIRFWPPYSPFLNPIEEFWAKLKDVVNKDPASVIENTQLSDGIQHASEHITRDDCQGWYIALDHFLFTKTRGSEGRGESCIHHAIFINANAQNPVNKLCSGLQKFQVAVSRDDDVRQLKQE
ncbi:hypothetical protein VTP01DRAFT_2300 [Rhizomucor pusillus]|uniref:uncharacterized protein n=1 Tax=Rhizomucor pusillus TaxID=4840 RepID=UPI003743CBE1